MILTAVLEAGVLAIGGNDADTQLSLAIAGLLGLAVLILISTIVYWRVTRPVSRNRGTVSQYDEAGDSPD